MPLTAGGSGLLVSLGSLIERPQYGFTASASTQEGTRFLRITDLRDTGVDWDSVPSCVPPAPEGDRYALRDGDLVVARIGATTGKAWLVRDPPPAVFASYLIRLRTLEGCDPEYLAAFFHSRAYWRQIDAAKGGRLKGGINIANLNALQVPLAPLDEQRRIARVLSAVANSVQTAWTDVMALQSFRASLAMHLLARANDTRDAVPLAEVVRIVSGQVDPRTEPFASLAHIAPDNVESGTGRLLSVRTAKELGLISGKYAFQPGDVIYSKIRPYLNKAVVAPFRGTCSADMYVLRARSERLLQPFLLYLLLDDAFLTQAISHQSRTGIPKVNREQLKSITLRVPSLDLQAEIVRALNAVDRSSECLRTYVDRGRALFEAAVSELIAG